MKYLICSILLLSISCCAHAQGVYDGKALPGKVVIDRLVVHKSKHILEAWSGKTLQKTYAVSHGRGGSGRKTVFNDNKTPEGTYRIDSRHRSRKFHLFMHISYPNRADKKRFKRLKKEGKIPSGAKIGGAIGVHGEKKGREWMPHKWADWTQGCIAVDNDEVEELYQAVKKNAVIEIHP